MTRRRSRIGSRLYEAGWAAILETLREILKTNAGRIALARRLAVLLALVALALYLSAADLGADPESGLSGRFFIGMIPWLVVVYVGSSVVRWFQREAARIRAGGEEAGSPILRSVLDFPGPKLDAVVGEHRAIASVIAGAAVLVILLLPLGWWSSATAGLRSVLEALPLGAAVAETPTEGGNPVFVCILATLVVGAAIWVTGRWRVHSVREYLYGGNTFVQIFAVGMIRTVTIFGGLTLIPVLGVIAAGTDLRDDPSHTFTGPVWPLLVLGCWLAFTYVGLRRLYEREAGRPRR